MERGIPEVISSTIINYLKKSGYKCLLPKMFHFLRHAIKKTESPCAKSMFEQDEIHGSSVMKEDLNLFAPEGKHRSETA